MSTCWAENEFKTILLGHKRIEKRAIHVLSQLGNRPSCTIPQAFNSAKEMKACYRFFDNDLVKPHKILSPHIKATISRIAEYDTVLILSDTTSLNYSNKTATKGLGTITRECNKGFWAHCSLAVSPEGLNLGVSHTKIWAREGFKTHKTNHEVYKMPIEEKELYRWIESYTSACEIARECPGTKIISISDREADFAELFEEVNKQQKQLHFADIIVRAVYDRSVYEEGCEEKQKLKDCIQKKQPIGKVQFTIPKSHGKKERKVIQTVTAGKVSFKKRNVKSENSPFSTMNVVMAREEKSDGDNEPLTWFFLTTLPIETFEDVKKVIDYYRKRWEIETFFNVLKNGCKVEERQLREAEKLESLISMYLIVAWRVMYTTMLGRTCENEKCTILFNNYEWKAAWQIANTDEDLPEEPPKLGDFVKLIATFGGYINRKGAKPPGVKAMWKGLQRLRDFSLGWEAFEKKFMKMSQTSS